MSLFRIRYFFTQIKKQQIIDSSYDQLVDRIARNYVKYNIFIKEYERV